MMRILLVMALIMLNTACVPQWYPSQKARVSFHDEMLPPALEVVAHPMPAKKDVKKYLEDARKGLHDNRLTVAVIDSGVDYTQASLVQRIEFTLDAEKKKLEGAGLDMAGESSWAHPRIIDPSLFAYGAKDITPEGRILGELQDPIEDLRAANKIYMEALLQVIAKKMPKSFIAQHIDAASFNILSAYALAEFSKSEEFKKLEENQDLLSFLTFSLTEKNEEKLLAEIIKHEKLKEDLDIVKIKVKKQSKGLLGLLLGGLGEKEIPAEFLDYGFWMSFYKQTWMMSSEHPFPAWFDSSTEKAGMTSALMHFFSVEGSFQLKDLMIAVLDATEKMTHFKSKMNKYLAYRTFLDFTNDPASSEADASTFVLQEIEDLHKKWFRNLTDYAGADPLKTLIGDYCHFINPSEYEKPFTPEVLLKFYFEKPSRLNQKLKDKEITTVDNQLANKAKINSKYFESVKILTLKYLKERGVFEASCANLNFKDADKYQAYEKKTHHVYMASLGESHGTHVAGIVAAQNPKIAIFPIKIPLESYAETKLITEPIKAEFLNLWEQWILKHPRVEKSLQREHKEFWSQIKTEYMSEGESFALGFRKYMENELKERTEIGQAILGNMVQNHSILEAIKAVGKAKIKVANMSFGGNSALPVTSTKDSGEWDEEHIIMYYFSEFGKYLDAKTIKKYAPHTIFVAAAGNEGLWVDSISHSSEPCRLASELYDEKLDNLVCVGSTNQHGQLSSFTNMMLKGSKDQLFLLAEGESILSPIISGDCEGSQQVYNDFYGKEIELPSLSGGIGSLGSMGGALGGLGASELLEGEGNKLSTLSTKLILSELDKGELDSEKFYKLKPEEQKRFMLYRAQDYDRATAQMAHLIKSAQKHACVTDEYYQARLSGTSMASPLAAGAIADFIIQKMEALKITDQKAIYDHEAFQPLSLIKELKSSMPKISKKAIPVILEDKQKKYLNYHQSGMSLFYPAK